MQRPLTAPRFWNSKLGHAALASIGAMAMMILLSSQIQPGAASAAPLAPAGADTAVVTELA